MAKFWETLKDQLADPSLWVVLDQLAAMDESERSAVLRPYDEGGFLTDKDRHYRKQRLELDQSLDILTRLEIAYQIGSVKDEGVRDSTPLRKDGSLEKLVHESGAFVRYASAYGYYGVCMLAYRKFHPSWWRFDPEKDKNQRPFTLAYPPFLGDCWPAYSEKEAAEEFDRFLQLPIPDGWSEASEFLDGLLEASSSKKEVSAGEATLEPGVAEQYELWLRGLLRLKNDDPLREKFRKITKGIRLWAHERVEFYRSLGSSTPLESSERGEENAEKKISNPLVARFALADIYWIARILRADVSANASISYAPSTWLASLRFHKILANRGKEKGNRLLRDENNLRVVFDFVCDLVQNSVELTQRQELEYSKLAEEEKDAVKARRRPIGGTQTDRQKDPQTCSTTWRRVFDEELRAIDCQRVQRAVAEPIFEHGEELPKDACDSFNYWSERLTTGKQPHDRIGLAFSGGGIRSATFNLGVLQGLQEFDLLRYVDYLSTVSGGGFMGAWLVGNVKRAKQWLGRNTCWDESIAHLRAYSSYLAPRTGILSPDTWTLAVSWLRNALLIQLTTFTWLIALLLVGWIGRDIFLALPDWKRCIPWACADGIYGPLLAICAVLVVGTLLANFWDVQRIEIGRNKKWARIASAKGIRWLAVLPAWFGGFFLASLLWSIATQWPRADETQHYFYLLCHLYTQILCFLVGSIIVFGLLAGLSLRRLQRSSRVVTAAGIAVICFIVEYLLLCAVLYLYLEMVKQGEPARFGSYAYVFGPPLVLVACTLSIVILIGLTGRSSIEAQREWWTRFGTWVCIFALLGLGLSLASIFGPRFMIKVFGFGLGNLSKTGWGAIISWLGTVVGGLLAGNSSKTSGTLNNGSSKRMLELLARIGALIFIIGAVLGASAVLYFAVLNIATPYTYRDGSYWLVFDEVFCHGVLSFVLICAVVVACGLLFSWLFDINIFGLSQLYRNRLVRSYLGATRWTPGLRSPQPFTKFDFKDDSPLSSLRNHYRGPFPIFNCTLNLTGSSDLTLHTRHSASFSLTPLRCGADRPNIGFAPTWAGSQKKSFAGGVLLGQAIAVSGAAASPNMGYNTSPLSAMLLTLFNVRLGWWFPNPGKSCWNARGLRFSLRYLARELLGDADETSDFVNVSDGGHFENLGIYELIRRRCKLIIAGDAECDESLQFQGLGNLVRICATDFGAHIDIDVRSIRQQREGRSLAHSAVGKIKYSNGSIGYLIYLKASITGDEDIGIAQYRAAHPSFPHETTANQFFAEDQFEAYRMLGRHIIRQCLRGIPPGSHPLDVAKKLVDTKSPSRGMGEAYLKHTQALDRLWAQCKRTPALHSYLDEVMAIHPPIARVEPDISDPNQPSMELCLTLEMVQLMEDVFLDLQLDDYWDHPDNRGWAILFMRWARSRRFRRYWKQIHRTFGIRFEYFCADRLGLPRDRLIVRA